jgi:hypothetical protein
VGKIFALPFVWGFFGSLVYAAGRLSSVVFGEARDHARAVRKAAAYFIIAIVFGPFAAQAFGPTLVDWVGNKARPQAIYFIVGLSINAVWPTIQEMAWKSVLAWLGNQMQEAGKLMAKANGEAKK